MAHGRGGRTPRRDTPRVSAIGLARTPTLRKAVAFEQRRGSKPPLRGDQGSGGGARGSLRSSVGPARAHTLVHLLPLVASSGMRKQTYLYGLGINPHTILSTIPPAALKATSEANERGKPTMSSTPHHHGSTRARRVITPSNTEPMSTANAPTMLMRTA